ncbi:MAG: tagaturonate reductase [Bacteroidota bacterium]
MQQLSNKQIQHRSQHPIRILQFGGGNFIRAFVDWMVDISNEQTDFNAGVAIVKPTQRGDYEVLKAQDGLFYVLLNGIQNGELVEEHRLVKCVQKVIQPYTQWDEYLKLAEDPNIRFVVSNTTEAGIKFSPEDQKDDQPPKEFPAKLVVWLHHRFQHFKGDATKSCIFLPLELIPENGQQLKQCMLDYAKHWELESNFIQFIESQIFCDSLVDRIVSGYPEEKAKEIEEKLGVKDDLLVAGEYYHSWVIEAPEQVAKELPFSRTGLNVKFVDDLNLYRTIKVRLLNGAHTSLVPIGYLRGNKTVVDGMTDVPLKAFIEAELQEEIIPTMDAPAAELQAFANDVIDRFCNPSLQHQLMAIALNSTTKFVTRLLPSLLRYQEQFGQLPKRIVFALAALFRMYKGKWKGKTVDLKDDPAHIEFFQSTWQRHSEQLDLLVPHLLKNEPIWGMNMNEIEGLGELLIDYLGDFEAHLESLKIN